MALDLRTNSPSDPPGAFEVTEPPKLEVPDPLPLRWPSEPIVDSPPEVWHGQG